VLFGEPAPPGHKGHKGHNERSGSVFVLSVLSVPSPAPCNTRPAGAELTPAELRHRYDERAAVYEYEAGLSRPEAELRAWLDVALDYIEADPERAALPNREARALAARTLAAAGIPDPAASPLRIERGGAQRG